MKTHQSACVERQWQAFLNLGSRLVEGDKRENKLVTDVLPKLLQGLRCSLAEGWRLLVNNNCVIGSTVGLLKELNQGETIQ